MHRELELFQRIQKLSLEEIEKIQHIRGALEDVIMVNMFAPKVAIWCSMFFSILSGVLIAGQEYPLITQVADIFFFPRTELSTFLASFVIVFIPSSLAVVAIVALCAKSAHQQFKDRVYSDMSYRFVLHRLIDIEPDRNIARFITELLRELYPEK